MSKSTPGKLTLALKKLVLEWSADGHSSEDVAARLLKEHGVKISGASIREHVRKVKTERREMVQTAAAVKLGEHVMSDLDALMDAARMATDIATRTYDMAIKYAADGTVHADAAELCLKALDRVEKLRVSRLKFAGLDEKVDAEKASDEELARLVEKALEVVAKSKGGKR